MKWRLFVRKWTLVFLLVFALMASAVQAQDGGTRVLEEMVAMPDGVRLATTVVLPEGDGPWPVILIRTPYDRMAEDLPAEELASFGIGLVTQDMRGFFDSEGTPTGFRADRADGQATLDWIAAQEWSNGRVATFGGSALGIAQYLMAPGAADALVCQFVVVATPDIYREAAFLGGAYRYSLIEGWMEDNNSADMVTEFRDHYLDDDYWDAVRISDYSAVQVPAIHISGWYDIFSRGTIAAFQGYQLEGGEGAVGHQYLIMGPWTHDLDTQVGELAYPTADELPLEAWFLRALSGCLLRDNPDLGLPPVHYYTMGAVGEEDAPGNEWRTASTWPPPGITEVPVYLHPNNFLSVDEPPEDGGGDNFVYDPNDPTPTLGGANLNIGAGAYDQRPVERRDDVVVYSTPPLPEAVTVTGQVRAQIWIETDVPDTDIVVRLTDVYPDGRSMLVLDGIARARFHDSLDQSRESFLTPGEPVMLTIDLGPTSIVFNKGHRIRISVTSSNAPRFGPNPNTGAMFMEDSATFQIANTTILHSAAYPSALILPVE